MGASPNPDRYAYKAMELLKQHGHHAIPINPAFDEVLGEKCYRSIADVPEKIDTVTMYLGKQRSDPLADEIVAAKPRRIIMNPGAENHDLADKAEADRLRLHERDVHAQEDARMAGHAGRDARCFR